MDNNEPISANPLKLSTKNIVVLILLAVGLYFLAPKLVGVEQALLLLGKINKGWLILALVAELLSYASAAWLLGIIFHRLGHKLAFFTRYKISSIAAFTIHFLPLGVAGEAAFEYSFLKRRKVDSGSILLMWILRWLFNYSGFFILFLVGLILVPTYPKMPVSPKIISPVIFILILSIVLYIIYLYTHKDKFFQVWTKLFNFLNQLIVKFKKKAIDEQKQKEIFEDIYQGIGLFGKQKRSSAFAILAGILYWLGDITCLYFVFQSFGFTISWGVLLFGYCASTLLGIVSAVPGGMGITEGSMALIFTSMGVPATLALTAVLVFRLFSFWIWIPIGLLSYLSLRNEEKKLN